jgi:protein involved in sex pheromone biosynthesis
MKTRLLIFAACSLILSACAPSHDKQPTVTASGLSGTSDQPVVSTETKARLKQIEDEYHITLVDHQFSISGGIVTEERFSRATNALHEVLGNDYTNYTIHVLYY